ncbi:hypothetical protein NP233_g9661 [Leucocoprinus birnbaumii]|uniref:Uncharacterized protein n=1 Tax=Leucocoprinus birnbaumii TaxID=56174 RepID=A0AAD5VNI2_9AGAR|nr:hypothetical protein NP233_g9661 [Leucocoprinus birnbaumii]
MGFFENAYDFEITGGNFYDIRGNQTNNTHDNSLKVGGTGNRTNIAPDLSRHDNRTHNQEQHTTNAYNGPMSSQTSTYPGYGQPLPTSPGAPQGQYPAGQQGSNVDPQLYQQWLQWCEFKKWQEWMQQQQQQQQYSQFQSTYHSHQPQQPTPAHSPAPAPTPAPTPAGPAYNTSQSSHQSQPTTQNSTSSANHSSEEEEEDPEVKPLRAQFEQQHISEQYSSYTYARAGPAQGGQIHMENSYYQR